MCLTLIKYHIFIQIYSSLTKTSAQKFLREAYLQPNRTYKIEIFAKIVSSILDVWLGSNTIFPTDGILYAILKNITKLTVKQLSWGPFQYSCKSILLEWASDCFSVNFSKLFLLCEHASWTDDTRAGNEFFANIIISRHLY